MIETTKTRTFDGKPYTLAQALEADADTMNRIVHELVTGDNLLGLNGTFPDVCKVLLPFVKVRIFEKNQETLFGMGESQKLIAERSWYGRVTPSIADELIWLWQTREVDGVRKPYADALEKAVAAYRRPAPPYSTDGNEAGRLIEILREEGYNIGIIANANGWYVSVWGTGQLSEETCKTFAELSATKTKVAIAARWNEARPGT